MAKIGSLSQEQIRERNRVQVIRMMKQHKETTKHQLSHELKLSIPTITSNVNLLMAEGIVEEAGVAESTGGRKPVILRFNPNARYSFGVNISPERVSVMLMNLNCDCIIKKDIPYDEQIGFQGNLDVVHDLIITMILDEEVTDEQILGIGIALPGLVDEDRMILNHAPNLGVKDYDFGIFANRFTYPVFIENEANVAAFAETIEGRHENMNHVVYISITEGVGTGIIIDNQIYKSTHKKAGEFGHMRISDSGKQCNCGRTGCWELYASKRALLELASQILGETVVRLDDIFNGSLLSREQVQSLLSQYFKQLFIGVENIILGLNPEYVIIGGELGRYKDQLIQFLRTELLHSQYIEYEGTRIIFSDLKDQGSIIGAALLPQQDIFHYRKNVI